MARSSRWDEGPAGGGTNDAAFSGSVPIRGRGDPADDAAQQFRPPDRCPKDEPMSVFDTLRIAASGLTAQRLRMDVAASNIANASSTGGPGTGPYRPETVVFAATPIGAARTPGVAAVAVPDSGRTVRVYDPGHPAADPSGFVSLPDVDIAAEISDLIGAARSYSLNATVTAAAKQSALDALDIGR
jgi:flagellar basal-body rod protein FlgC